MNAAARRTGDDDTPGISRGRRTFRYVQIAVYLAFAFAIPAWVYLDGRTRGSMELLTWLLAFYMAARALAIFIKFRQETAPARYSRDYVEARDLFPDDDKDDDKNAPPTDTPNGSSHG
ncbi:MAG: hypothetical protein HY904_01110 [Deltaproteobacteria bacterium]|nr:hypothetical protein [Deltaproteobacteria bacterium]